MLSKKLDMVKDYVIVQNNQLGGGGVHTDSGGIDIGC